MDIHMEVGMWFEIEEDKDGNIIIDMPFDNNGNGIRLVIKKHQRRFFKVPGRTLRYDLNNLEKEGFIIKIGSTRGALYKVRKH